MGGKTTSNSVRRKALARYQRRNDDSADQGLNEFLQSEGKEIDEVVVGGKVNSNKNDEPSYSSGEFKALTLGEELRKVYGESDQKNELTFRNQGILYLSQDGRITDQEAAQRYNSLRETFSDEELKFAVTLRKANPRYEIHGVLLATREYGIKKIAKFHKRSHLVSLLDGDYQPRESGNPLRLSLDEAANTYLMADRGSANWSRRSSPTEFTKRERQADRDSLLEYKLDHREN